MYTIMYTIITENCENVQYSYGDQAAMSLKRDDINMPYLMHTTHKLQSRCLFRELASQTTIPT